MADINKIHVNSALKITNVTMSTLCFIDNLLVGNDKFSLANNKLELFTESKDNISLYYNYDNSNTYEYDLPLINNNVKVTGLDNNGKVLQNVIVDHVLVFVDGKVLKKSDYVIENSGTISLLVTYPTNEFKHIFVYVSNQALKHHEIKYNEIEAAKVFYSRNKSLVFVNGEKVSADKIEGKNSTTKINVEVTNLDYIEIYTLDSTTESITFYSTYGYVEYGPYDSYNVKVPMLFDCIATFDDLSKLVVDNIRLGFIIKEEENNNTNFGSMVVVDDNFEKPYVKCLYTNKFRSAYYTKDQYYLEVPEANSIINYLSDYDKNHTMIPEILSVFQKTLLNEVHDEVQRLRDMRCISKVDSTNINRLIKLLGFDANIRYLTLNQKKELLEELNSWYRIVGTKDSYNIFNIIQNDIRLINIEQLFTVYNKQRSPYTIYTYNYNIAAGDKGTGYSVGNKLSISEFDISVTVDAVDANGGIIDFTQTVLDGSDWVQGRYQLKPTFQNIYLNVSSAPSAYTYTYSVNTAATHDFVQGDKLSATHNNKNYTFTANVTNGKITSLTPIEGTPTSGEEELVVTGAQLKVLNTKAAFTMGITSSERARTLIYNKTSAIKDLINLQPGIYYYEISGAGGGGGAGAYSDDRHSGAVSNPGHKGEFKSGWLTYTYATSLYATIGAGGKGGTAYAGSSRSASGGAGGSGFSNGSNGSSGTESHSTRGHHYRTAAAGGGGGGSTALFKSDSEILSLAAGGNGGNAVGTGYKLGCYGNGGTGGSNGTTTGAGSAGGYNSISYGSTTTAGSGANGYIKIWKVTYDYTPSYLGDQQYAVVNSVYKTPDNSFSMTVTSVESGEIKTSTLNPAYGDFVINTDENYELYGSSSNLSALLSIRSAYSNYRYVYELTGRTENLFVGARITATNSTATNPYTFTGTVMYMVDNKPVINWDTVSSATAIEATGIPVYIQTGTGAYLTISSRTSSQKSEEREYIDFYTKEEKGATYDVRYVIPYESYGTVTEGTPNSPYPYLLGEPDISYGLVAEEATEELAYGLVSDNIKGKWVRYYTWNRPANLYPTNHVDVEVRVLSNEDPEELVRRFTEQFYNLSSTVLYLEHLIQGYYFGNTSTNAATGVTSLDKTNVFMGLMTGQPMPAIEYTMSSDPERQVDSNKTEICNLGIISEGADIEIEVVGRSKKVSGTDAVNMQADYGTIIHYTVSKTGYVTQSSNYIMFRSNEVLNIPLSTLVTYTINPTPADATVVLTATGFSQEGNSITVSVGTAINWTVSRTGYATQSGNVIMGGYDITNTVTLVKNNYTLTINPTPIYAITQLTYNGVTQQTNTITVPYGSVVSYSVSMEHYETATGNVTVTDNIVLPITLQSDGTLDLSDYTYTETDNGQTVVLTRYIGQGGNITTPHLDN